MITFPLLSLLIPGCNSGSKDTGDVFGSACIVYNEGEGTGNAYTLRKQIQQYNTGASEAICNVPSGTADDGYYDQAIYFMTDEWDSTDYYVNHVDAPIVLQSALSFSNSYKTLVIGMWNSETIPSTVQDYGQVTLDITLLGNQNVFDCDDDQSSGSVTLRNLAFNVCSGNPLAGGYLFSGTYPCLADGGAVKVVPNDGC